MLQTRLRELRKNNKYSQEDIANKLNISTSAYGFYEQGKSVPNANTISFLADLYLVTTDYLLGRSNNPKLTQEDEIDVYNKFEELKISLENTDDLMFCGEILDDETRELLLSSLKNTILTSKIISKERNKNKK